jgi:hypothetical protein
MFLVGYFSSLKRLIFITEEVLYKTSKAIARKWNSIVIYHQRLLLTLLNIYISVYINSNLDLESHSFTHSVGDQTSQAILQIQKKKLFLTHYQIVSIYKRVILQSLHCFGLLCGSGKTRAIRRATDRRAGSVAGQPSVSPILQRTLNRTRNVAFTLRNLCQAAS